MTDRQADRLTDRQTDRQTDRLSGVSNVVQMSFLPPLMTHTVPAGVELRFTGCKTVALTTESSLLLHSQPQMMRDDEQVERAGRET